METGFYYGNQLQARWAAELSGHKADLAALSQVLAGQDPTVVSAESRYYLIGSDLDEKEGAQDAHRAAAELIDLINGLAPALLRDFAPVSLTAHIREPRAGRQSVIVVAGTARVRFRASISAVVIGPNGTEKPAAAYGRLGRFLALGRTDPLVQRAAAFLCQSEVTWFDLYRVLEVIEEDLGQTAHEGDLCSRAQRRQFKGTVNSYSVLGHASRHGHTRTQAPPNPMSFSEARAFVLDLLGRWLEGKDAKAHT